MAALIPLPDLMGGYVDLVNYVRDNGVKASPRGQSVREPLNVTTVVRDPVRAVPVGVGRKLNLDIYAAETASLIGGLSDAEQMRSVSHAFGDFTNGDKLLGAYGPRLMTQIPLIIRRIIADPDTRQAVATIWNSFELTDDANRDMPCTVAVAFAVRGGHLYMTTFMRSNDVWLGVAYDYGMFTRLQITLAWALGVGIGEYTHTVANLHIYERDVDKTYQLHAPEGGESVPVAPIPLGWEDKVSDLNTAEFRWYSVRRWMEAAVLGQEMPYDAPEEARWYGERLKPHASGFNFNPVSRYVLPRADS